MILRHLLLCSVLLIFAAPARADDAATAFFENQVRPLLVKSCLHCHGPKKQSSSLRLDSREAILRGGDRGPAIVPGDPKKSLLIQAINHQNELRMPKQKLGDDQVAILTQWIRMGAPWPDEVHAPAAIRSGAITDNERQFWSYQPIRKPSLPEVKDTAWPKTDVDRFILARLEEKRLKPAPLADKRSLLRRVTFDLIGLPPTPAEIQAFLGDDSPDAFKRVVDRLLASPHYGERWGRHWLDVVRYADTAGETADYPVPQAYRYRNYVIDAFNADKPYDEFLREQIAGDILANQGPREKFAERITATGYLAISRRFGFDPENYFHLTIQDTIDTVGQTFLGLSLGCARCHDHKFDPILRDDYYALYGIFESTRYAVPGSESNRKPADFVPLVPAEEARQLKAEFEKKKTGAAPYEVAYAVTEGKPHNARIQRRGEPRDLGDEVPRRFLAILGGDRLAKEEPGSGRLALAGWLSRPENPLTARVMVNRIWQHHFGVGLVATPNDFGTRGQRPTHPELLDYLAWRFQNEGWSIKAVHRLIVLSRAYQLSGTVDESETRADPENRYLARYPRRRLDAESIRDAMLAVSGKLDPAMAGPHPFPPVSQWGFTQHAPFAAVYETNQRSVYLMTQRLKRYPFLALFDGADTNASTPTRVETVVPTQALFLMNDPFVHVQADAFALRILATKKSVGERIGFTYEMALGRPPSAREEQEVGRFLESYRQRLLGAGVAADQVEVRAWAALARTLFARNEFLFVD
jgi:hypothetical protein